MISLIKKNNGKLEVTTQFQPDAMSMSLSERASTATLSCGSDAPEMAVGGWLRDETGPGKGTVWRIRSIDTNANTGTLTVQLEHIINVLRDAVMFGEVKTKNISGKASATPAQAVTYILGKSSDWTIGSVEYTTAQAYEFNGDTLYDALETVSGTLEDCWWTYDLSVYPFKLSIVKAPTEAVCEMRMGRNISSLKRTLDLSRMYTRLYPVGQGDLHIAGDYVQKNTDTYGVISKVETDNSITDAGILKAWAQARLARHCEPTLTVTISGQDLSEETGVALDRLTLGTVCRVPLPEFGTTITERIVKMVWQNKIADPTSVTVTLANELEDAVKIIAGQQKSAGRSARAASKKAKEDNAWFEDTNDHVAMCARGIIGVDAQGNPNWERLSRLEVNAGGIYGEVKSVQGDLTIAETRITANENNITLEAKRATKAEGNLSGKIDVQADRITNEVTRAVSEEQSIRGALEVQAERVGMTVGVTDTRPIRYVYKAAQLPRPGDASVIYYCYDNQKYYEWNTSTNSYHLTTPGQYIKAGEICVSINESGESTATIEANKIHLLGETIAETITADYIGTKIANIPSLTVQAVTGESASFTNLYGGSISFRTSSGSGYAYTNLKDLFVTSLSISQQNNVYTLSANNANAQTVSSVTFNSAGAVTLKDPVWTTPASSSITGNSNTVKVETNGKPTEVSKSIQLFLGRSDSWSSGTRYVYLTHTDSAAGHRVARIDVTIPSMTVQSQIATYGNTYPTSINGGNISKSGITTGKYMTMTVRCGGKDTVIRFYVTA